MGKFKLEGAWQENSGRVWHCTQDKQHITWTQEGTGRVATGICVPHANTHVVALTFDNTVHWKLTVSDDQNALHGPSDTFKRVQPITAKHKEAKKEKKTFYPVGTTFSENSGKTWTVTQGGKSHVVLHNNQDGRDCNVFVGKNKKTGQCTFYLDFAGTVLKAESGDANCIPLSNGDCFKKV
ncbi:hypothetical protein ABK040_008717 [Willaertia magna]